MRISDWSSDVCSSDLDPFQRLLEMRMGRVRLAPEGIHDPHVDAFEQVGHFSGQAIEISRITHRLATGLEAQAGRGDRPVRLSDYGDADSAVADRGGKQRCFDDRRVAALALARRSNADSETATRRQQETCVGKAGVERGGNWGW